MVNASRSGVLGSSRRIVSAIEDIVASSVGSHVKYISWMDSLGDNFTCHVNLEDTQPLICIGGHVLAREKVLTNFIAVLASCGHDGELCSY